MNINKSFPISLLTVAMLAACNAVPPKNVSLTDAHNAYDNARANRVVATLAEPELKAAGESLGKADEALSKGKSADTVNHLSYVANQKVHIAQATAMRKNSELALTDATSQRDNIRLDARTAEADASKAKVADLKDISNYQAAELAAADANARSDQALISRQQQELKELNAQKTDRGMVITLGDVLFHTNKADLQAGGMRNVQKLADFMKEYPKEKIQIEGYTDSTGSEDYNQSLSERRASSVETALIDEGVDRSRITTRGYGEQFPVGANNTAGGRKMNRRVEIVLSDEHGNIISR